MAETTQTIGPVRTHSALSPPRSANGRTPPGYRVLHVIVPEPIFNHVKAQAYLSGMRFPEYVARILKEAWPYTESRQPPATSNPPAAEIVSP
jgi:hypothetical protein